MNRIGKWGTCFALAVLPMAAAVAAPAMKVLPQGPIAWARAENDQGAVAPDLLIERISIVLQRPADRQQAFEALLQRQQDPASPDFHRWLTPVEVGERFGLDPRDIETVTGWLRAQGLQVDGVAASRVRVAFSGTAAKVAAAFGSPVHAFVVDGESRVSITGAPAVPAAIAPFVQAIHGLSTVRERSYEETSGPVEAGGPREKFSNCSTGTCVHYLWPADFAKIYNIAPLYQAGTNGRGQTIGIVGRARVYLPDIENFQARANLPSQDPTIVVPPRGLDPGDPASDSSAGPIPKDQSEATLDVTRAGSVAPGATVLLVVSADTKTTSGLAIAADYIVDTTPVPAQVMSISYGACEQTAGRAGVAFWDSVFSQAAAEGISSFVSSGDGGIAGCDAHHVAPPTTPQVASPNYICSSGYATCVGGTQFVDTANPSLYWAATNTQDYESAFGYIPEGAWNEPLNSSGALQVAATGGGVSAFIATPSWQSAPGVPAARAGRYTPDISFSASSHVGYMKCQAASNGDCVSSGTSGFHFIVGSGTSASTPSMAGIAALLNQQMNHPQGNLNPRLYALANIPGNGVFHDVTLATSGVAPCDPATPSLCNNSTPGADAINDGLPGYLIGDGYDLATGLGSLDVSQLFALWNQTSANDFANFQGLWWASPAGSESGWGINFAHQADTIFATWFTYDLLGKDNWLVMTATKSAPNTYTGKLYSTTGPAFSAIPFSPSHVVAQAVGNGALVFTGPNDGTFNYTVGTTTQVKNITREIFGTLPTCATAPTAASLASATNYTDLWWAVPAGSESGWGINLNHEGTTIFATWFTYDPAGNAMWLVITATPDGANSFSGDVYRTSGPAFNAQPFNPANVAATKVGTARFAFADGNTAIFSYTVDGFSQTKQITREIFSSTGTVCH